jgi:hypothetical protein
MVESLPTTIKGGCEGCGGWEWDNELVVGVVWKEALESTTQSVGEGEGGDATRCEGRARGGAPTVPLGGEGDNEGSIAREAIAAQWVRHVMAGWGVELDAVTENMVHDLVEGHENTPDKVAVVKEDANRHEAWDGSRDRRRSLRARRSRHSSEGGGAAPCPRQPGLWRHRSSHGGQGPTRRCRARGGWFGPRL